MTREKKSNLPASVLARLLARSKETGDDYETLLTAYVCERFLFRLAASEDFARAVAERPSNGIRAAAFGSAEP